jgi:para-nitrobenzyl esterase
MGAFHILEVPFMFDNLDEEQSQGFTGDAPKQLASAMHGAWVAFAKSGNPSIEALPGWPRYELAHRSTMIFDLECRIVADPDRDEREAWSNVAL